ncbi:hypothetical protein PsorP6_015689 [Peronosclerospora sorghi]|uniref:Uncharacterized protein n=1 Tax=Peronosclerospora sorghi TaxID=230839 RepID=A0ACC0WNN6_9STRA|nr:hypothetical protein PsorP6_015689 [Peronosclerospora sorghi]
MFPNEFLYSEKHEYDADRKHLHTLIGLILFSVSFIFLRDMRLRRFPEFDSKDIATLQDFGRRKVRSKSLHESIPLLHHDVVLTRKTRDDKRCNHGRDRCSGLLLAVPRIWLRGLHAKS